MPLAGAPPGTNSARLLTERHACPGSALPCATGCRMLPGLLPNPWTLRVTDGSHIAKLAILGNYMATSFVTAADGHGGTLITEVSQTANQLVPLTTPHPG